MIAEINIVNIVEALPKLIPFNIEISDIPRKGERISLGMFLGDPDDHGRFHQFKEDYIKHTDPELHKDGNPNVALMDLLVIGVTHKACETGHYVSLEVIFKF